MNLKHDYDELNFTIHQCLPSLSGQTVKPLTVRAIIDHITMRQRGAATLSDAERSFLADFGAAEDPGYHRPARLSRGGAVCRGSSMSFYRAGFDFALAVRFSALATP